MPTVVYGFTSFISQFTIIREIIASFHAGEFFISFIIGWWIISTALTSYISKKRLNIKPEIYIPLFHIVSPFVIPFQISLIKITKSLTSPLGETTPILLSIVVSMISTLIYTIPSGVYFQKASQDNEREKTKMIYLLDSIGFGLGAIVMYIFSRRITPHNTIALLFIANMIAIKAKRTHLLLLSLTTLLSIALIVMVNNYRTLSKKGFSYFDTYYGRIELFEYGGEKYIYYNSARIPLNDELNTRKALASSLFIPQDTKEIICISSLVAFCKELREFSSFTTVQINQDKYLLETQQKITSHQSDIKQLYLNPIDFLLSSQERYNAIISETSLPLTPGENILFSKEFIKNLKKRITDDGVYINIIDYPETPTKYHKKALSAYFSKLKSYFKNIHIFYDDFLVIVSSERDIKDDFDEKKEMIKRYGEYLKEREIKIEPTNDKRVISEYIFTLLAEVEKESKILSKIVEDIFTPKTAIIFISIFLLSILIIEKDTARMISSSFLLLFTQATVIFLYQLRYGDIYKDIALILASVMFGIYLGISIKKEIEKIALAILFIVLVLTSITLAKISLIGMVLTSAVLCGRAFERLSSKKGVISYLYDSVGAGIAIVIFEILLSQINDVRMLFLPIILFSVFLSIRR